MLCAYDGMIKKNQNYNTEFPYHISARCNNKEWFDLPLSEVWIIMENNLFLLHHGFQFQIHSFVLMSNHFHMIARTPNGNLSAGMNYFMRETSRQIAYLSNRINHVYGGRFHRTLITCPLYYLHAYKYVYRNPVEAGIVDDVCAYPYSTLHGLVGLANLHVPVCYDDTLFSNFAGTLLWLNTKPHEQTREEIRKALKKATFSLALDRSTQKPSKLESAKY
jgi:putative transposase